jgi:phosphatidylethanolamine/phosphatidyl-N-methylethanolamine N-methyltransferase
MAILNISHLDSPSRSRENKKLTNPSLQLFAQFLQSPRSVGTVLPSSGRLAQLMIDPVDFSQPSTIVEFGPGTGSITSRIAERLRAHSRYIGIETNKKLFHDMSLRLPYLKFVNRSAADIESILKSLNIQSVDAILSGIPWASLPVGVQPEILDGAVRSLRPGGVFVTFAYVSGLIFPAARMLRHQLRARFSKVETSHVIWNNFPPAFTYVCHR